jgi:hypothetical protein
MRPQASRIGTIVAMLLVTLAARDGAAQSPSGQWEPASLNAGRQAAPAPPAGGGGSWPRVQQLKAGKEVIIGVRGREPLKYVLLAADGDGLVVVKPIYRTLDGDVIDALIAVGAAWPDVLAGEPITKGDVAIKSGGVYVEGERLTGLADVVERIERAAVTEVRGPNTKSAGDPSAGPGKPQTTRGALIGAGIGFGAGAAAGAIMGFPPSYCGEQGPCPDAGMVALGGAIGAGIGALIGALRGEAHGDESATFYVAPKGSAQPLDDVPWERLRLALPPSLQGAGAAQKPKTDVRPSPAPSGRAKGSPWSVTL